jgi:DhnA family fructose-bisphosphate aldolase class Ia
MDVKDKKFVAGLRSASALNVVAAGATIRVPLDKSTAAFERLNQCVEKNNKAVETNPFVAPARRP